MTHRPHIFDLNKPQLKDLLRSWGMPHFRAGQVLRWVYERGVADPHAMTDLSKADRETLAERLTFITLTPLRDELATDGTRKLLLELPSEISNLKSKISNFSPPLSTECVMIPADSPLGRSRRTACISSQVGCPVGCAFCASGLGGLDKNLTAGQIVEQVWQLNRVLSVPFSSDDLQEGASFDDLPRPAGVAGPAPRITNVVFMGMGEPLANYAAVVRAIRTLAAPWGMNLSARRITLSTVGLPAQIRRLADQLDLPITLAISLHAPGDELRREIIPWAERTSVDQLIDAGRYYFEKTGREVTLEYILLGGVNDKPEQAARLAAVARRLRANVNLIRYNEVAGLPFRRPITGDVHHFQHLLRRKGVNTHLRASRGRDIAAACGQLRHEAKAASSA